MLIINNNHNYGDGAVIVVDFVTKSFWKTVLSVIVEGKFL